MVIGLRLHQLWEAKVFLQSDVAKRTDLRRFYISQVECGYVVPSLVNSERIVRGFGLILIQLFYAGNR